MNCSKKVIVTGLTGLIGKELVLPLLNQGFEIYAITRNNRFLDENVNWIQGDIFDENFVKKIFAEIKPTYLLNLAWVTTGNYLSSDINYKFLTAGISLIQAFKDNGGQRAIYIGTCFEYKFKNEPLQESDELEAKKTAYTFCKNKLHEIVEYYCKSYGISFGYGRIFYVYGRNEDKTRLTGMIVDKLSRNEEVIIKNGNLYKDYMSSKDIAGALAKFLDSNVEGSVNICTGEAISIRDFSISVARKFNKENLIIFKDEKNNQPPIIVGDNKRLINEIGYCIQYDNMKFIQE